LEWIREERADIRRAEAALERMLKSLKARGKWWWMWRLLDVQHELHKVKREMVERQVSDTRSSQSVA